LKPDTVACDHSRLLDFPISRGFSLKAFAAFANVGYRHEDPATDYSQPGGKPSKKVKTNMGDKSPKSVHKQSAQKQVKANAAAQKKKQAAAAKQVVGKK